MLHFFIFILFFCFDILSVVGSGGNVFGQTHFSDLNEFVAGGPIRIDLMPYLPISLDQDRQKRIGFFVFSQYANSTNNDKLSQFFLPNGNLLLTVTGGADYFIPGLLSASSDQPNNKVVRDIDANVLNITDQNFFSIVSIIPESSIKYLGFFGYYVLKFNENNTPLWAIEFAFPIINSFHKIVGNEVIYKTGKDYLLSPIKSALDGLSRDELLFQRWNFNPCGMSKTAITNIEFNLSYNYLPVDRCSVETYFGCLIPLNNCCKNNFKNNVYVFAPEFENSQHFGLQYGTTISLFLYQNNERSIKFILGNNLLYFLPKTHFRSFDLQGRPWSKYLYAYQNFMGVNHKLEPLVNFLSFDCRVSPNFSNIATTQIDYIRDFFNISVGYSLFARQSESVTILEDLPNVVLKGSSADFMQDCSSVSIVRNVSLRLPNEDVQVLDDNLGSKEPIFNANYYYAKIDNTMIDIASATHPAIFSGELYIKGAFDILKLGKFLLGTSYRFSHNNTAIEYVTCWMGIELIF